MTATQYQLLDMPRREFVANLARPACLGYSPPVQFPEIHRAKQLVIDLETYDPDLTKLGSGVRRDGHIVGAGVNADGQFKEYYPVSHIYGPNCKPGAVIDWLREQLAKFRGELVGANSNSYDLDYLQMAGVRVPKAFHADIQWAEPLLDEFADSYSLESLAQKYLGQGKRESNIEKLYGPDWKNAIREVHPGHLREYVLGDVELPFQILAKQKEALSRENLLDLYRIECRLNPLLLYMRERGVAVDIPRAEEIYEKFGQQVNSVSEQINIIAGFPVNFNAPASMEKAFKAVFNMRVPSTEKGNPSIKNEWLESIGWKDWDKRTVPNLGREALFARLLTEVRETDRIKETFVKGYILDGHVNGRIYCEFHPLRRTNENKKRGTVTGRFSSSNPNLQNIPIHTAVGKLIRSLFVPDAGKLWFSNDLSQIEYRYMVHFAYLCKCTGAAEARERYIRNPDTDYHQMVSDMTNLDRNKYAKTLNFLLVFGGGKAKLAREIGEADNNGEPTPRALEIFDQYHKGAPYVREMLDIAMQTADKRGYVKDILGRRGRFPLWEPRWGKGFPLPEDQAREKYGDNIKRSKVYKALNKVVQGSAASHIKVSMLNAWDAGLFYAGSPIDLSLTEHDELDGSLDPGEAGKKALDTLTKIMQNAIRLEVPVLASSGIGQNWGDAH